jgi:phosphatidate phosphatase APP1
MDVPETHRAYRIDLALLQWRARRAREHGHVAQVIPYTGYGSTTWIRVLGRVHLADESARERRRHPAGSRGWRNFTSVWLSDAEVQVDVGGEQHAIRADRSGIIDEIISVNLSPGWQSVGLSSEGSEPAKAWVYVVDPETRFGVVSDIDDTVMVTALPRPLLAAWHTFVVNEHARATTPGMPVLYERLVTRKENVPIIYLSTGAWNVGPTLTRFLSRNLYPAGALLLTDWGPTASSWFRSGREHKRGALERLAREFPEIKWLLIGDDGQHDPEIYGDFVSKYPDHASAVCIRQLTPGEAVLAGSSLRERQPADASPVPWLYASDGAGLAERLEDIGLLEPAAKQPEVEA